MVGKPCWILTFQIFLSSLALISGTLGNPVSLDMDTTISQEDPDNQIPDADYFSALGYPMGHLNHWSILQSISQTTPSPSPPPQGEARRRKSIADLAQLYAGNFWNCQKDHVRKMYSHRSDSGYMSPPTTSAEYFMSEIRRLFADPPVQRRPYAMRLRWG